MRVVVIGGTGNVGTSTIAALAADERVGSILGVARRLREWEPPKTEWARADITEDDLVPRLRGADAVIHLAWAIQPSRDEAELRRGECHRLRARLRRGRRGRRAGPRLRLVDRGLRAGAEGLAGRRVLADDRDPDQLLLPPQGGGRVDPRPLRARTARCPRRPPAARPDHEGRSRSRDPPALRRSVPAEFRDAPTLAPDRPGHPRPAGPGGALAGRRRGLRLAAVGDAGGPFNIAAAPTIDPGTFASHIGARTVPLPARVARALADATWRARLQPTPPGWLDMALSCPIMDTTRARLELGWSARHDALEAITEVLEGIADADGFPTPPLDTATSGPARSREIAKDVGARNP